jgi:hypothetical protein
LHGIILAVRETRQWLVGPKQKTGTMAWKAGAEMTKVMKGLWQALPFDGVDAGEQMLRMFKTFLASANKEMKQAVFQLLGEYILTGCELERLKQEALPALGQADGDDTDKQPVAPDF